MKARYNAKEARQISPARVREWCMERGFYTYGTNEEYEALFDEIGLIHSATAEDYLSLAVDIWEHSDRVRIMAKLGMDEEQVLEGIMFGLARHCTFSFFEVEAEG